MNSLKALEFDLLLRVVASWAQTQRGRELIAAWRPFDRTEARLRSILIAQMRVVMKNGVDCGLHDAVPMETAAGELRIRGRVWDAQTAWDAARMLRAGARLQKAVASEKRHAPDLWNLLAAFEPLKEYVKLCESLLEWDDEERRPRLKENASPELVRIRKEQRRARESALKAADRLMAENSLKEAFASAPLTVREGRFVLGVRSDSRRKVPGILHDRSGSGSTFFIEPESLVPLNNRLAEKRLAEKEEEARLMKDLTEAIRPHAEALVRNEEILVLLDSVAAAARFAEALDCVPVEVSEGGSLELQAARHPFLDLRLASRMQAAGAPRGGGSTDAVPVSLALSTETKAMVVTGPNTGGKTVLLKTIGLFTLMAETGIPVPAERAVLPHVKAVYADIGDAQDLMQNLSTFSGHMRNIADMFAEWKEPALVLLDEMGSGTDPDEGAALAMAILDTLINRDARVFATTHHGELKAYAHTRPGAENATMEFDERTLRPTYRVIQGVPGRSRAMEIARGVGLPEAVMKRASEFQTQERRRMEEVLEHLERERAGLSDEQRRLREERERAGEMLRKAKDLERQLRAEKQELSTDVRRRMRRALDEFEASLKSIRSTVRVPREADDAVRQARSRAEAILEELAPMSAAAADEETGDLSMELLKPGMVVRVASLRQNGTVQRIVSAKKVEVEVGGKRFHASVSDLRRVNPEAGERRALEKPSWARPETPAPSMELMLLGSNVEDALGKLEKFLDGARLSGCRRLRIVHGKGTGALRKAVRRYLKEQPFVVSAADAEDAQGGSGATAVELDV